MKTEFLTKVGQSVVVTGAHGRKLLTLSLDAKGYRYFKGNLRGGYGQKRCRVDRETAWSLWQNACQIANAEKKGGPDVGNK